MVCMCIYRITYELLVEGTGLEDVKRTDGIDGSNTTSNNILEVENILGIEAGFQTIVNELQSVYGSHGLDVNHRHLMLMADVMTSTGKVLGFTRHGLGKVNDSVLAIASFEETMKHLFNAALAGEKNDIHGVSDSIIVGAPIPIGSGIHTPKSFLFFAFWRFFLCV